MQCHEMRYSDTLLMTPTGDSKPIKTEKEAIHSGHFMVSHFEAEAQDDEYEVAVPVPEMRYPDNAEPQTTDLEVFDVNKYQVAPPGQLAIETSLTKLFQCMSLAYRQKLTSPKWNRFKGIRLRWKDKIRLNNVIWRCWHMQFIKKENTLICQFASPLDEGTHNKPEAVVLEGKYWKRKLAAVTAEYKKWRMFYRNRNCGGLFRDPAMTDLDMFDWQSQSNDSSQLGSMMVDEDYMELMSDTLFSTITSNQPFAFPDTREIARGAGLADFIQPSLVQLQPNLDDIMDTLEPLQEFFSSRLPPVPEDCAVSDVTYRVQQAYPELNLETQPQAQTETLDYNKVLPQSNPPSYPVVSYAEPIGPEPPQEIKTARFYLTKIRSSQPMYSSNMSTPNNNSAFAQSESVAEAPTVDTRVVNQNYSYETETQSNAGARNNFTSPGKLESFKVPAAASKQQPFKYHQYQKISPAPPPPPPPPAPQYNRIQQNYDLAVSSQHSALPDVSSSSGMIKNAIRSSSLPSVNKDDVFAMPKQQHMLNLKSRHRTRSGSSLIAAKPRSQPPPLSSANSDSAINISSALLAQLLTNSNSNVYNVSNVPDRVKTAQPVAKSTNIPILPMPSTMLPMSQQNTFLITNPSLTSNQSYLNPSRPTTSPDSPPESSRSRNTQSPGAVSQSPTSPLMFNAPLSPSKSQKHDSYKGPNEHRRVCHINAEQKRRYNIKNGFDVLHSLIPHLHQNPNVKLSKAAMLQKGAEYIRQLQAERLQVKEEMESLKYQIESLNTSISNCQSLLPATGAPVSRHRTTKMKEMFDEFVRVRTMENWKFWIFSVLFEPLLQSFNCSVSTASYEDLYRSTLIWVEQHCSLVDLRPAVLNSLRNLSTTTEILSDPTKLPEEARAAVNKKGS